MRDSEAGRDGVSASTPPESLEHVEIGILLRYLVSTSGIPSMQIGQR